MTVTIYTQNENTGALKQIAEVPGLDDGPLAVDALLDEMPRLKDREFVCVVGSLDDGIVSRVIVEDEDAPIVQPRRRMRNTRGEEAPAPKRRQTRKPKAAVAEAPVEEAPAKPARKKPGPKPGTPRKTAAKPAAAKPAAKKTAAPKPGAIKRGGTKAGAAASKSAAPKKSPFQSKDED